MRRPRWPTARTVGHRHAAASRILRALITPQHNLIKVEAAIRDMVAAVRPTWFVTADPDGIPQATFLPIIWRENAVVMQTWDYTAVSLTGTVSGPNGAVCVA